MRLFLGVDGGQSSTTALVADENGNVLGRGSAGPCNHVDSAEAQAKLARVVTTCVSNACQASGISDLARFEAACFGMSGGPADKRAILEATIPCQKWLVTNDGVIALSGALAGEPGVIVIAGTGSIALGRGLDGGIVRAGGWGYVYGDEGGAFDIVRQALRACLRAEEGWGSSTGLSDVFLEITKCRDMNAVLHLFYTDEWPRSKIAKLASVVSDCASGGDETAMRILVNAAQSLALFTQSVRRQIWQEDAALCAYVGGVFRSAIVVEHFRSLVELSGCSVTEPLLGPACGALLEAFRLVDEKPDTAKLLSSKFRHE